MRKYFVLSLVLILGFAMSACQEQTSSAAQTKIGVVDVARLMRDSEPGKAGVKFLEDQQKALQAELDEIQDRLEKTPDDQALMQELQKIYADSQQRIQAEGQNVAGLIFDTIVQAMNSWRDKNGYDAIFAAEAMASYKPALDVTDKVMAEVNQQKVEFKPLPPTETAPAPQAETAAPAAQSEDAAANQENNTEQKEATDKPAAAPAQ